MSLLCFQVPIYTFILANALKMAARGEKENPPVSKISRRKIPVSSTNPDALNKYNIEKFFGVMDRHPLGEIQARTDGGMTHADKPKNSKIKAMKRETNTTLTQVSPKGSVYKIVKSKTTTKLAAPSRTLSQDRMKHVTIRKPKSSPLDWNLEVFKDAAVNGRTGRTDTQVPLERTSRPETRSKSADRPSRIPVLGVKTPTLVPIAQHNRVKNIKRSLKRPSSRELQNRKSGEIDFQAEPPLQGDLWPLKLTAEIHLDAPNNSLPEQIQRLTQSYERRIISYLQDRSEELRIRPRMCPLQRSIVMNWLVKLNSSQNPETTSPQVLQVAVRHLDRILAQDDVAVDGMQLLAAACFWLAQKQCAKPRSSKSFARLAAYAFAGADLMNAERYVLRRLNWPSIPVVADDFVPHLAQLCSPANPEPLKSAATFLCTAAMLDAELSSANPDLLAMAAVLSCVRLLSDMGDAIALQSSPIYRTANSSNKLHDVRAQLLRTVIAMRDEKCPCREPYVQHSGPPHRVAPRLAAAITAARAARRAASPAR